jgi:hypothetical protein
MLVKADDIELIKKVHLLMAETFDEDEIDPIEVTCAAIGGTLPDGSKDLTRYRIFVALDQGGDVASVFAGGLLELLCCKPGSVAEAMFMEAYAATRGGSQRLGIFRELYLSSLMQAAADARAERKRLTVAVGECTWRSEPAWNAIGQKRIYLESGMGHYTELPYIQPPVDWDAETGGAADGAGDVPEHLMIEFFEGELDKDRLITVIDAIYRWNNRLPETFFASLEAHAAHKQHVDGRLEVIRNFLFSHGRVQLLTAAQRDPARGAGTTIDEHSEADI